MRNIQTFLLLAMIALLTAGLWLQTGTTLESLTGDSSKQNNPQAEADSLLIQAGRDAERKSLPKRWPDVAEPSVDVQEHVLDNGLRVLLLKQGTAPVVSTHLWYRVGSAHEKWGETGVAHYLEHMMFKGGQRFLKGDIDRLTAKHGGTNNAFTSTDYTAYYFSFPSAVWTLALDIELDRMTTLELDQAEFDAEKAVVQEESNISFDDPADRMWEEQMHAIFGEYHPYSHPILGWPEDVESMSVAEMRAFHEKYYTPNNATLVIVGDIDPAQALQEVKQRFDSVPRGRASHFVDRLQPSMPKPAGKKRLIRFGEVEVAQGAIVLPGRYSIDPNAPAYEVLAEVLAGGENSRLYQRLIKQEGLCESVSAFHYGRRWGGSFHVMYDMQAGSTEAERNQVEAIVYEEFNKLLEKGPTQEEVQRAIREREVSQVFERESSLDMAEGLGYYDAVFDSWRWMDRELAALRLVKPADVSSALAGWDFTRDPVESWLLPEARESDSGPDTQAPEMPVLDVREVKLGNGLRLLMLPMESGPEVFTLRVDVNAGSETQFYQPTAGLIDLFDATIGAGTTSRTREEITAIFDANGGSFSTGARGISARVLARDWQETFNVAADILQHANYPEDEIELERKSLITSVARQNESHQSVAGRAYRRLIYGGEHPWGSADPREIASVEALKREQLLAHHKTYVIPRNTRIIAVGRFDPAALEAQVREELGGWQNQGDAPDGADTALNAMIERRDMAGESKVEGLRRKPKAGKSVRLIGVEFDEDQIPADAASVLIDYPSKAQCIIMTGMIGISRDNPDYYALRVMDHVLGTSPGFADRFSRILRDEMGLAYSVYANISRNAAHEPSAFLGYIGTRPENVPQALEGMRALIQEIGEEPVSDAEFETARNYLLSTYVSELEGSGNLASLIAMMDEYDLGWDYLRTHNERIAAVTKEDIQRVAAKYLVPERMITVISGPLDRIPSGESGFGGDGE